jgi:release factor glutamine methyltransferase
MEIYMQFDRPLIELEVVKMRSFLKRCIAGEPVAYILGEVEFLGCRIEVTSDALIPRPETEIMVDLVLKTIKKQPMDGKVLWDLCTGSGCIGLAIKRACPDMMVVLSDICPKALALAQKNSAKNQLTVEWRQGDLLQPFKQEKADFVVCNPPYVSKDEFSLLDQSVRDFEPSLALLAGDRGTDFYERLALELPACLNRGAQLFFEIGHLQGTVVQEIFSRPPWRHLQILKDWSGHDRFFFLEIE